MRLLLLSMYNRYSWSLLKEEDGVDSLGEGMFLSKKMYFTRRTATREMVTT